MAADSMARPCLSCITLYAVTSSTTGQSLFPTHVYTFTALDEVTGKVVFSNADLEPTLDAGPVHHGYHKGLLDFLMRFPDLLLDRLNADKAAGIERDAMQILSELGRTRRLNVLTAPGRNGVMFPYTVPLDKHIASGFSGRSGEPYADAAWIAQVFLKAEEAKVRLVCREAETSCEKANLAELKKVGRYRYDRAVNSLRKSLEA